ncbi:uncharacterized protein [Triticum aestivum]|uniref:uncharacterized protein n=1 Tax=Triticum aestivum TaxID=4565 RepID=UPI001D00B196|nr:uncharacterized protein LOC123057808 [Triticum aestivum]
MSSSSSSSLPVPADWLLPLMGCPLCGDEVVTAVARTGNQAGHRFYKCIRHDARQCRFFEFQRAYCRRMTHEQILGIQPVMDLRSSTATGLPRSFPLPYSPKPSSTSRLQCSRLRRRRTTPLLMHSGPL